MKEIEVPEGFKQKLLGLKQASLQVQRQVQDLIETFLEARGVAVDQRSSVEISEDCSKLIVKEAPDAPSGTQQ